MENYRPLLTSHARIAIGHKLLAGEEWKGSRRGIAIRFTPVRSLTSASGRAMRGPRVEWAARIAKQWQRGRTETLLDAVIEIERRAISAALARRTADDYATARLHN